MKDGKAQAGLYKEITEKLGIDPGPAQAFWEQYGYGDMPFPDEMLHDLVFDPHEADNLTGSETLSPILKDMRACPYKWIGSIQDPMVGGEIPEPPARKNA